MTTPEPSGTVRRPSSHSSHDGTIYVEVSWRTSSYSASHGDCVEVASAPDTMLVRDSKDRTGLTLTVPTTTWRAFLTTVTR
jgi:uncharacterized protein DUF397